jgi:glyoxylase I family protein
MLKRPYELDHINHVALRVRDLERSVAFYLMLGAELRGQWPLGTAVRVAANQTLVLQPAPDPDAERSTLDHICLAIQSDDIDAVTAYLQANHVEIIRGPTRASVGDTINVRDPDGNELEIRIVRRSSSEEGRAG